MHSDNNEKSTTANSTQICCEVCQSQELSITIISGLRWASCPNCHHSQRIDIETFDYATFAMGSTAVSQDRLLSQCHFIAPYLKPNAAALEIGCAAGNLANFLKSQYQFSRFDGIELSPAREIAATVMDQVFAISLDKLIEKELIQAAQYDIVLASHCLEHFPQPKELIENIQKVLRPDGVIFIEVPNGSGNPALPFDDNRSHLHFFSVSSLTRLLASQGLFVLAALTGARHDARYSDSLRIIAKTYSSQTMTKSTILSDRLNVDKVIVWGAGKICQEMLEHYFDLSRIELFVDNDEKKQGSLCLGKEVRSPQVLLDKEAQVVLINSLESEQSIRQMIEQRYKANVKQVIDFFGLD